MCERLKRLKSELDLLEDIIDEAILDAALEEHLSEEMPRPKIIAKTGNFNYS